MVPHSVDWNAIAWTRVRDGVERKAFSSNGATMALNRLQPGHAPNPHRHEHEQIVYIVEGKVELHLDDQVHIMGPGQLLVVPPNALHWAVVVGGETVLNLDVFTPKRPEYAA